MLLQLGVWRRSTLKMVNHCYTKGPFVYRLSDNRSRHSSILMQVCLERGWIEYHPQLGESWNLWWKFSNFSIHHLYPWQYVNHIPKSSSICRKDKLVRYLKCMKNIYGSIFYFGPPGYNLPLEYTKFAAECNKNNLEDSPIWVCKPIGQSQGKGVYLFKNLNELRYDNSVIVQQYIKNPFLIGGYKFDLRLYVCVLSYYPLTIYLYKEGLVRFATEKFTLSDLENPFRHLTNCSVNKFGSRYCDIKDIIGTGCKWPLCKLRKYFQENGISDWLLWQRISSLVVLTLLAHITEVPGTINTFDFFGFDILVDSTLTPWLLEVNLSPALVNDCDVDYSIKKPMLHEMFNLLGFPYYSTGLSTFSILTKNPSSKMKKEYLLAITSKCYKKDKKRIINIDLNRELRGYQMTSKSLKQEYTTSSYTKSQFKLPVLGDKENYEVNSSKQSEGDWVKIWPLNMKNKYQETKLSGGRSNTNVMVAQLIRYNRICKEISKIYPAATQKQLNNFFQHELQIENELWFPFH